MLKHLRGVPRIERGASPRLFSTHRLFSPGTFCLSRRENHTTRPHPRVY